MSLRDELLIPFRGSREAGRDLLAGLAVIGRFATKALARWTRKAFNAGRAQEKPAAAADWLENAVAGLLTLLVAGIVLVSAGAALGPRARPYLPLITSAGLLVLLVGAWTAAPARPLGNRPKQPPEEAVDDTKASALDTPEGRRRAFLQWLEQITRGASGIHLGEIHRQLTLQAPTESLPRHHVRPLLNHYGIPVERTLRVGRIAGRSGVTRQAVLDALATPSPIAGDDRVEAAGEPV